MKPSFSNNLNAKIDFVIFDVDNVIIDTISAARMAQSALGQTLTGALGKESADRVEQKFISNYNTLTAQAKAGAGEIQENFQTLLPRIQSWQKGVLEEGWEMKLWSREILLAIALEENDIPVRKDLIDTALNPYWHSLTTESKIRPDACQVLDICRDSGAAVHLATASDGFLEFNERQQTFFYDPQKAVQKKLNRMAILQTLELQNHDVSVGDPIGKPDERFFSQVLKDFEAKLGRKIELDRTLAVGDNLCDDVLPLLSLGVARGAWLVADEIQADGPRLLPDNPRVGVVNSLNKLPGIPWSPS